MINITLAKEKYRNPNNRLLRRQFDPQEGTRVFMAGRFGTKSSNQGGNKSKGPSLRPRRRAYGPW